MAVPMFILIYIYPVIFMPIVFVKTLIHRHIATRDVANETATFRYDYQRKFNERLDTRKRRLISHTLIQHQSDEGRPLRLLDAGSGSGANFAYIPSKTSVICVDPNANNDLLARMNIKQFPGLTLEAFHVGYSEYLRNIENNSVDAVISTYSLCSVSDIDQCLREFIRVLRPVSNRREA
jgi:ubiquinone/menaquinone biosynthesis C-methylase UbiE